MSGGSLDYVYQRVEEAAGSIRGRTDATPLHLAFAEHLDKVAKALHDIEWVYSCDYGEGREEDAIMQVVSPGAVIEAAEVKLRDAIRQAEEAMKTAEKMKGAT